MRVSYYSFIFYILIFNLFPLLVARNNAFFILVGLGFGTTGGFLIGFWLSRPHLVSPIMKSIAILKYDEKENANVCATSAPHFTTSSDVLVRVKAASINRIDKRIACGYGRTLRNFIQRYDRQNPEFPLILGRSCSGVVEAVGKSAKSGLEIGDEVWLAAHWFERGVASELVVVNETRISRKPFLVGFEGAASLPYSGAIALNLLEHVGLNENTSIGKRVLIQDANSPLGCVLSQLLSKWGAYVTTTCHSRSAPVIHELGEILIAFFLSNF
jgi:NADPH:quinone reductase-like Zn-dependent oxidoreductase